MEPANDSHGDQIIASSGRLEHGFFLLGGLLVWVVVRLLRSNREQLLASGPMTAEQEFALREAAALLLLIEVPRFGSRFRELEFEVVEQASGRTTKLVTISYAPRARFTA